MVQFGFRAVGLVDLDTVAVHVLTDCNKNSSFCKVNDRLLLLKEQAKPSEITDVARTDRQYYLYDCKKQTKQALDKVNMADIFFTPTYEDIIYLESAGEMVAFESRTQELHLFNPVLQTARVQTIQVSFYIL